MPVPVPVQSAREPVRRALSVACQYSTLKEQGLELHGTHHDPIVIRDLLIETYGWRKEDVTIMMDDEDGLYTRPTRENILKAMRDLVADAHPGDRFVFHFSGHGSQVPNLDGTEDDGYDEVLWPIDVVYNPNDGSQANYILDDEVRSILVKPLPAGAHCTLLFDCCSSGTAADLPNFNGDYCPQTPLTTSVNSARVCGSQAFSTMHTVTHDPLGGSVEQTTVTSTESSISKGVADLSSLPDVTSWSACMDSQLTLEKKAGGLFVKAFAHALRAKPRQTHAELLRSVTHALATITAHANARRPPSLDLFSVPKPQLGSLQHLESLFEMVFTL